MNDVIINPMWIYMFETIYNIIIVLMITMFFSMFMTVSYIIIYYDGYRETYYRKRYQIFFKISIILLLIIIFVPSKETAITMIIAKNTTYSSINNLKDIILETIKQVNEVIR